MMILPSSTPRRPRQSRGQSGVALIEALVGMVLIALCMLATAGLQLSSFKFQKSADNRFLAMALVGELAESIDANRIAANAGSYALATTSSPSRTGSDCATTHCTPGQLASYDLAQWTERVANTLPMNQVTVEVGTGVSGLVTYTIRLNWDEPRGRQTYESVGTTETLGYVLAKVVRDGA